MWPQTTICLHGPQMSMSSIVDVVVVVVYSCVGEREIKNVLTFGTKFDISSFCFILEALSQILSLLAPIKFKNALVKSFQIESF